MRIFMSCALVFMGVGSSLCVADDAVMFSDDFVSWKPGWGEADDGINVGGNKLLVKPPANKLRRALYLGRRFDDADIRIRVVQNSGTVDQAAGLAFWGVDNINYYALLVQSDGSTFVGRYQNGKLLNIRFSRGDEVRKGVGASNDLRVVTSSDSAIVYVNDKEITRFHGFPPANGNLIGVHAESGAVVATWAFSELSAREGAPHADARRPRDADLLYAADFSTFDPSWGKKDETKNVRDGKLELNVPPWSRSFPMFEGRFFHDVDLRVKVTLKKGALNSGGGIIFWAKDASNYYAAQVEPGGAFLVSRRMNGKWLSPVRVEARDDVRQGIGGENELRVVTSGRLAVISINGREATRFKGFPPEGGSKIGVYGDSGDTPGIWAFSDLTVRQGPPPPASAQQADNAVYFAEDFSTADPSWGPPRKFVRVAGGKMLITPEAKSLHSILYQGTLFDDADMRVKVTQVAGALDRNVAGLQFWVIDDDNYCTIDVGSGGGFALTRIEKAEFTNLYMTTAQKDVKKGLGQVNELRVVTKGNHALVFVNGVEICEYTSKSVFPPPGGGAVGLFTSSKEEGCQWEFTDLKILKPK